MGVLSTGVSNGVSVTGQTTGVSLYIVGDYAQIIISNAAPTPGPDTQGLFTISGTYPSATVAFEKCLTFADFNASNWTPLMGIIPRMAVTGATQGTALASNTLTITTASDGDYSIPSVQGFYAVRVRLTTAIASGAVVVSGATFPASTGVLNPAVAAAYSQFGALMSAFVLWASNQDNTDYLAAVGGSF